MNAFCPPRHFRRDADLQPAPGTIVAECANGHDALALARMKGPGYTVTAGINLPFAVRKVCEHPIKHIRANEDGDAVCTACGVVILESAATDSLGSRDASPAAYGPGFLGQQ